MKRIVKVLRIFTIAVALCVCGLMCVSCEDETGLESVEFITKEGTPTVYTVGEFDYNGYKLVKTYTNGTVEELPFTEEYLSDVEKLKMWQPGEQTITFNCEGEEFSFTCKFNRNSFDGIELIPLNITYDGKPHELEFSKAIPSGTEIKINSGNSLIYTDAGNYTASVTLIKDGYMPKDLTAEVNISKAKYDTSTFTFEDESYPYDNKPHSLEIRGKLPQGVSVRYVMNNSSANSAVNIGEYKVTAEFTYTNLKNYEPLEPITRTLRITKRSIDISKIERDYKNKLDKDLLFYDGESKLETIKSGIEFPQEINSETVKYTFKKEGESQEIDDVVYAGNYELIITFAIRYEYQNQCEASKDTIVVDFSVQKAYFSTSQFAGLTAVYSGDPHEVKFEEEKIPAFYNHDPIYYIKPYGASDSEYVEGNSATRVGKYTVKVEFPEDENFTEITSRTATLTINKFYYDISVPTSIYQEYDGSVYTLQSVVDSVYQNIDKSKKMALTVKGIGLGGDILPDEESGETTTAGAEISLNVILKMYKVNYIKDEVEYNRFIAKVKNIFETNSDKEEFELIEKIPVEKTDGIGIYLITTNCESDEYQSNDKIVIYSISPRKTDFSKPQDATRITYDGENHASFFDLSIPSYVANEGKNFYTKRIFETEKDGTRKREVKEVITAGYYCCEYQLIDDPNFAYTCGSQFTVKEFEIRKMVITTESISGFTFTTLVVKKEEDIRKEAEKNIKERYPLLEYGRDYTVEVVDSGSNSITFPIDPTKQYYLQVTIKDEVNYIAYEGLMPVTVIKEKFNIIDPEPLDELQLIPDGEFNSDVNGAIYYIDDITDVRLYVRNNILTIVYEYKDLTIESIEFFTKDGEKIEDDVDLNSVGKYYAKVKFADSLYYTISNKNTDLEITVNFEYRKKIIIDTKTDERLRGNCDDDTYKYIFYTADGYNVSDVIAITDNTLTYYKEKGLKLKENPKMFQLSEGASVQRDNTFVLNNGGEFKITYTFQDNYDFVIDGRSTGLTYNVMVKVIKVNEIKNSDFSFSLDSKGIDVDMYSDVINELHYKVSGYTNLQVRSEHGVEQITIKKGGNTYTSIKDTGTFNVTMTLVSNGIYYRTLTTPIDGKYYTLDDLTFNFTVEIKSKSPEIGTVYFKATSETYPYYPDIYNKIKKEAKNIVGDGLVEEVYIYNKGGNEVKTLLNNDFGYYTYKVTYTNKTFYEDSTGTLVFAPKNKIYIDAQTHGDQSMYSEFLIEWDRDSLGNLSNPRFKGRAYNIYDYFVNIKGRRTRYEKTSGDWYTIDLYKYYLNVSESDLNAYESWDYGFFVFGDNFKRVLLNGDKFFRVEVENGKLMSHDYTIKFKDTETSVSL